MTINVFPISTDLSPVIAYTADPEGVVVPAGKKLALFNGKKYSPSADAIPVWNEDVAAALTRPQVFLAEIPATLVGGTDYFIDATAANVNGPVGTPLEGEVYVQHNADPAMGDGEYFTVTQRDAGAVFIAGVSIDGDTDAPLGSLQNHHAGATVRYTRNDVLDTLVLSYVPSALSTGTGETDPAITARILQLEAENLDDHIQWPITIADLTVADSEWPIKSDIQAYIPTNADIESGHSILFTTPLSSATSPQVRKFRVHQTQAGALFVNEPHGTPVYDLKPDVTGGAGVYPKNKYVLVEKIDGTSKKYINNNAGNAFVEVSSSSNATETAVEVRGPIVKVGPAYPAAIPITADVEAVLFEMDGANASGVLDAPEGEFVYVTIATGDATPTGQDFSDVLTLTASNGDTIEGQATFEITGVQRQDFKFSKIGSNYIWHNAPIINPSFEWSATGNYTKPTGTAGALVPAADNTSFTRRHGITYQLNSDAAKTAAGGTGAVNSANDPALPANDFDWIPAAKTYYFDSINSMANGLSDHVVGVELTTTGFYASGDGGGSRFVKMAAADSASRPAEIVGKIIHQGATEFYASVTNMQERTVDIRRFGVVLDEPVGQAARFNTATLPSNEHWLNIPEGKTLILDGAVDRSKLNLDGLGTIRCDVDDAISCSGEVNIWNTQIDANQKRMPLDFTNNNVLTKSVVFGGKAKIYNSHSETFNVGCRITGNYAIDMYNISIDGVTARANDVTGDGDGSTSGIQLAGPITYCDIHNITINNVNSLNALDVPIYEDADGIKVQTRTSDNSQPKRLRIRHGVFTNCGKRALKQNATAGNIHVTVDEMHVDSQWVGTVNDSTVVGSSDLMLCAISMNTGTLELDRLILTGGRIGRAITGGSGVANITINDISQNQEDSLYTRGEPTTTVFMEATVSGVFDNLFINRIHGSCYVSQVVYAERIKNVTINNVNGACGLIGVETVNCDHLSVDKMNLSILDDAGAATTGTRYGVYSKGAYTTLNVSDSRMVGGGIRSFVRAAGTPATNTRIKVKDSYCDSATRSFIEDAAGTIPDGTYNTRPIDVVRCYESAALVS